MSPADRALPWLRMQVRQRRRILSRHGPTASPARREADQRQLAAAQAALTIVEAAAQPQPSEPRL